MNQAELEPVHPTEHRLKGRWVSRVLLVPLLLPLLAAGLLVYSFFRPVKLRLGSSRIVAGMMDHRDSEWAAIFVMNYYGQCCEMELEEGSITRWRLFPVGDRWLYAWKWTSLVDRSVLEERSSVNGKLMKAAGEGDVVTVKRLLTLGADPDYRPRDRLQGGWTPFLAASTTHDVGLVRLLLDKGADVNTQADQGETALILAIRECQAETDGTEMVQALLARGADPDLPSWNGRTPLMQASTQGHPGIVDLLLRRGADLLPTDGEGKTALLLARTCWADTRQQRHQKVIRLLAVYGAKQDIAAPRRSSRGKEHPQGLPVPSPPQARQSPARTPASTVRRL
jgi:hypothetical protein